MSCGESRWKKMTHSCRMDNEFVSKTNIFKVNLRFCTKHTEIIYILKSSSVQINNYEDSCERTAWTSPARSVLSQEEEKYKWMFKFFIFTSKYLIISPDFNVLMHYILSVVIFKSGSGQRNISYDIQVGKLCTWNMLWGVIGMVSEHVWDALSSLSGMVGTNQCYMFHHSGLWEGDHIKIKWLH